MVYSHAWNAVGDHHFDVTEALVLSTRRKGTGIVTNPNYVQIVRVNSKDAEKHSTLIGLYGNVKAVVYGKSALRLKSKKALKDLSQKWYIHTDS